MSHIGIKTDSHNHSYEYLAIYQCTRCVESREIFGEPFEVAFTFMVAPDGKIIPVDMTDLDDFPSSSDDGPTAVGPPPSLN